MIKKHFYGKEDSTIRQKAKHKMAHMFFIEDAKLNAAWIRRKDRLPGKHFRTEIQRAAGTPTNGQEKRETMNISHKDYIKRNYASMQKHAA